MGADLDCWCLDRRRFKGRDRQDQRHSSLPGASGIQGIYFASRRKQYKLNDVLGYQQSNATAIGA